MDNFAQVFAAARRSGGAGGNHSYTAGIIRDKVQVQEEIHHDRIQVFEQKIMNGIPF